MTNKELIVGANFMKSTKKKRSYKTVSQNSIHSDFYTILNFYNIVANYSGVVNGGRTCYLPNGTKYRKKGIDHSE